MYVKKMYNLGKHKEIIEVHNFYPGNYGAPGQKREKREKASPEVIKKQNHANRVRKIQRLILGNFKAGDWHIVLKYKKELRPDNFEEAKEQLSKFFKKVRLELKRNSISFKYIGVTEMGKKGNALHHHIIVENITEPVNMLQLIRKHWEYGHIALTDLYEEGAYQRLAEYIVKAETKDPEGKSSYKRSRGNLIEPQPESKIMLRKSWPKEPKAKKGYYIIADSVISGENPVTGYPYQRYMMQKLPSTGAVSCRKRGDRVETECRVNIYITTSIRGPAKRNGGYGYVIEFIKKDGSPITRSGVGYEIKATENKLVLMALKVALKRLTKRCSALVFTKCEHVLSSYKNGWIFEWKKNDWTNARGVKLSNWELWRDIWELSTLHDISFASSGTTNPYEMWISDNIRKVENEK